MMFNPSWEEIKRSGSQFIDLPYTTPEQPWSIARMLIYHFTGIRKEYLKFADVPTILSWASRRQASRREDTAYCLLDLLRVKMTLLYKESSADFLRLLEEVIKKSNSHGIQAAWYDSPLCSTSPSEYTYVLPKSPIAYRGYIMGSEDVPVSGKSSLLHFSLANARLSIELPPLNIDNRSRIVLGLLNCQDLSILISTS
ncbi:hypothetical protein F4859DRAFT_16622 [Xylaria cf. heliscus]|nr:hypothetical protein F4859DRAFT_16622 [Xylaria cf. heliscus]